MNTIDFKNVTRIALTGGPASGKSSVIKRLKTRASDPNVNLLFLSETATTFFKNRPERISELDNNPLLRQYYIFRTQLFAEDMLLANTDSVKPTVLITDRGALDLYAFLNEDEIAVFGKELDSLWSHYDHVIHLRGTYNNFIRDEETTRIESTEDSLRDATKKSLEVWSKCPSFCLIEQQTTVKEKVNRVIEEIHRFTHRAIFL